MAEIQTGGGGKGKKGQPKKINVRVDFTPMVDMNMLLLTFFMMCTTLSKPQTMEIAMPAKDNVKQEERSKVADTKAITVLLDANNKLYYYLGKPNYTDFTSLKEATYGGVDDKNSFRSLLNSRNSVAIEKVKALKRSRDRREIKEDFYKEEVKKIRNDKNGEVVIIKPTDKASYQNLIDVLDEVAIAQIGTYAIDDVNKGDQFLIDNLKSKGTLTKNSQVPAAPTTK